MSTRPRLAELCLMPWCCLAADGHRVSASEVGQRRNSWADGEMSVAGQPLAALLLLSKPTALTTHPVGRGVTAMAGLAA